MKRLLLIVMMTGIYAIGFAQYPFNSAGGSSTVLKPLETGAFIGYDFGKSSATFLLNKVTEKSTVDSANEEDFPDFGEFRSNSWKLDILVSDNSAGLLSGGDFNPGFNLSYTHVRNFRESDTFYPFITVGWGVKKNNFAHIQNFPSMGDSIFVDGKLTHTLFGGFGFNWIADGTNCKSKLVAGVGLNFIGNWNSPGSTKSKDVVLNPIQALNGSVQKSKSAFFTDSKDFTKFQPRLDLAWTPFLIKESELLRKERKHSERHEVGPRLGFISSFTADFNNGVNNAYNFSIGPSLHQKYHTDQVLAVFLFEFVDFTDETGDKEFNDIFSISFYVGLPIGFKGIK